MANYDRVENKADIRRKEKIEKTIRFAERIKKIQEKAGTVLKKAQEEIK